MKNSARGSRACLLEIISGWDSGRVNCLLVPGLVLFWVVMLPDYMIEGDRSGDGMSRGFKVVFEPLNFNSAVGEGFHVEWGFYRSVSRSPMKPRLSLVGCAGEPIAS